MLLDTAFLLTPNNQHIFFTDYITLNIDSKLANLCISGRISRSINHSMASLRKLCGDVTSGSTVTVAPSLSVAFIGSQLTVAVVLPLSATTFLSGGQVSPNEGRCVSFMKKKYNILRSAEHDAYK